MIKVYTIRDIKHKNDRPHGIVNNNAGIVISISYSTQGSAFLKIKYYNSKNSIVQHLPLEEREKKLKLIVCVMVIL